MARVSAFVAKVRSLVAGRRADREFDEDSSTLVYGPIRKERWIYSASKQLLDRVIWAMGTANGLRFTVFRPFNWYGPHLDDVDAGLRAGDGQVQGSPPA